jgi:ketosteroid isomerase-like protein
MVSVRESIESKDLEAFTAALAEDVVWVGLWPGELCRNREQVVAILERARAAGREMAPEVVLERENMLVVDPHLPDSERHQIFMLTDGLVSEIRAYPNRAAAVAAFEEMPQW